MGPAGAHEAAGARAAERADVLVDFSKLAGSGLVMKNHKPEKPVSNPAPQLEPVMQIRVGRTVTQPGPTSIPSACRAEERTSAVRQ